MAASLTRVRFGYFRNSFRNYVSFMSVRRDFSACDRQKVLSICDTRPRCLRHERYHHDHRNQSSTKCSVNLTFGALAFSLFWKQDVDEFNLLVAQARTAEENLELTKSDELYHKALILLEDRFKAKKLTESEYIEKQTVVFNYLSNICLLQGKVRQGEELMKATLQGLFSAGRGERDNTVLEISLKLANVYALQHRDAEAIAGYRFCYRQLTEKMEKGNENGSDSGSDDADTKALLGLTCDNYGRYLLSQGEYIQAERYLLKALEMSRSVYGESHPQSLLMMNNLATLSVSRKQYTQSRHQLEEAVRLAKHSTRTDTEHTNVLAAVYCNLAMVYHYDGMKSESFLALKEAENLAKLANNHELEIEIEECRKKINS